ncbi:hypothetical protein GWI33_015812 [Rhynchophorus ferrugineus]|uniref:Uncharacterized protein n=1 Tax=Rhynchophorus ferrugineus TaxID=354439 RepID=A0A834HZ89_RHYFE|nr:hypothetical protein GWI33_015812 [Rhynchophorus ferrugineus]
MRRKARPSLPSRLPMPVQAVVMRVRSFPRAPERSFGRERRLSTRMFWAVVMVTLRRFPSGYASVMWRRKWGRNCA